jgi:hypothetical protein
MIARQRPIGGIAVHLQNAREAGQLPGDLVGAAAVSEYIGDCRRRRTAPRAIIDRVRAELAGSGVMSSRIAHRHRGLDRLELRLIEALEPPCGTLHLASERRAIEMNTLAGQNLDLPI